MGSIELRQTLKILPEPTMVAESQQMQTVVQKLRLVAAIDCFPVLLEGETGVGKQEAADFLHATSKVLHDNLTAPFVDINCSGLSSTLLESELFGHELGAFTGAVKEKVGLLELGYGGSVFLDEIGDAGTKLQKRLLKFLDNGQISRVGGTKKIEVRARVIAATNGNLERLVVQGRFRSDLFQRLNVYPIRIPPLRDRTSDIEPLVRNCIMRFNEARGTKVEAGVGAPVLQKLEQHSWPGNVRELFNAVERAIINKAGKGELMAEDFMLDEPVPLRLTEDPATVVRTPHGGITLEDIERIARLEALKVIGGLQHSATEQPVRTVRIPPEGIALEEIERIACVEALKMANGIQLKAAKLLKISSRVLNYSIKKHGIGTKDGVNTDSWRTSVPEDEPVE